MSFGYCNNCTSAGPCDEHGCSVPVGDVQENPLSDYFIEKMANKRFEEELRTLLNRHSKENDSDTPDFILAQYLLDCLESWNKNVKSREQWYGRVK